MSYQDKNGVEFKEGDYYFYTEMPYSNYADSLNQVVEHPETGELCSVNVVFNNFGVYKFSDTEPDYTFFKYHSLDGLKCKDSQIVEVDSHPLEFMNTRFPLKPTNERGQDG